ncbi:MAG: glycosyltransferase family 4 protein [Bacteroidales bacterium]
MRILILCNKPPFPPKDGGSLAEKNMIEGLIQAGHVVKVISVNSPKYKVSLQDIPQDIIEKTALELIPVDLSIKPLPALLSLLQRESYQVKRFYKESFAERLKVVLRDGWDIVQFETIFPAVYLQVIKTHSQAKVILRAHNIEHHIWQKLYENEHSLPRKWYLKKVFTSLKKFELEVFSRVDGIAAITERDKAFIELSTCKTPLTTCPFGVNINDYPVTVKKSPDLTVFYLAAMNWAPNAEGLKWFLNKVWPIVASKVPGASLRLAGRHMPGWILQKHYPGVEVVGEVIDSWKFFLENSFMIVPLFSGSGVRIKIIEGMLAGKAIISTTLGASGIDCIPGKDIILADDPGTFAESLVQCFTHPEMAELIGLNARRFALKHHDLNNIIPELTNFYSELLD